MGGFAKKLTWQSLPNEPHQLGRLNYWDYHKNICYASWYRILSLNGIVVRIHNINIYIYTCCFAFVSILHLFLLVHFWHGTVVEAFVSVLLPCFWTFHLTYVSESSTRTRNLACCWVIEFFQSSNPLFLFSESSGSHAPEFVDCHVSSCRQGRKLFSLVWALKPSVWMAAIWCLPKWRTNVIKVNLEYVVGRVGKFYK